MARLSLSHDLDPSSKLVPSRISRIAYPTDLSDTSDNALYRATQIAKASAADLLLLTSPPVPLFEAEPFEKPEAERALSVLLATVKASGISARGLLLTGTDSLGKQIVRRARLERIDHRDGNSKAQQNFQIILWQQRRRQCRSSCSVSSFSNSLQPYKHSSPLVHG